MLLNWMKAHFDWKEIYVKLRDTKDSDASYRAMLALTANVASPSGHPLGLSVNVAKLVKGSSSKTFLRQVGQQVGKLFAK